MKAHCTLHYTLTRGQTVQLLVEKGSAILAARGCVTLRRPFCWLAETMVATPVVQDAEETWVADVDGWLDINAAGEADVVVIAPQSASFWRRVGLCM